jgi:uncharacterized protein YqeY
MSLITTIDQDIKQAMLAKQEARLRALRAVKSALLLAKPKKARRKRFLKKLRSKFCKN